MTDLVEGTGLVDAKGKATGEMARWMKKSARDAAALGSGKAAKTQTLPSPWLVKFPDNGDEPVIINSPIAFTINSVTTKSSAGTATLTVKIGSTALGGTANSVSTSEQTQAHSSANAVAVGDDVTFTFSSVSGAENVSVMLSCTVELA
ncbi:MAG: hypothetical protein CTY28_10150 [Hyphomicrobium sp.]|nr:MAG: hypothetical protein CTY28_10150 [Hyphomicrobium sp.]